MIEAELDKGKGPVATVLVQKGTLKVGETIAAGACYGKIRAMMDDKGRRVKAVSYTHLPQDAVYDIPSAGKERGKHRWTQWFRYKDARLISGGVIQHPLPGRYPA